MREKFKLGELLMSENITDTQMNPGSFQLTGQVIESSSESQTAEAFTLISLRLRVTEQDSN